jgi:hypothetical protein
MPSFQRAIFAPLSEASRSLVQRGVEAIQEFRQCALSPEGTHSALVEMELVKDLRDLVTPNDFQKMADLLFEDSRRFSAMMAGLGERLQRALSEPSSFIQAGRDVSLMTVPAWARAPVFQNESGRFLRYDLDPSGFVNIGDEKASIDLLYRDHSGYRFWVRKGLDSDEDIALKGAILSVAAWEPLDDNDRLVINPHGFHHLMTGLTFLLPLEP